MPTLTVKTPVYEGPLDVLLELIEKRKLLINDIALATVADDYIAHINALPEMPVQETSEFVSLAATLLLIKSRSLLPTLELSPEESRDIKELEYRLAVYQLFKEASLGLQRAASGDSLFEGTTPVREPMFLFDSSITIDSVRAAAQALIDGFPKSLALPQIGVRKIVSIEEVIEKLSTRVNAAFRLSFHEFTGKTKAVTPEAKYELIVSFLALLELVKQGILKAQQDSHFGDIMLESDAVSTPTYE